jgi:hypothetical protein
MKKPICFCICILCMSFSCFAQRPANDSLFQYYFGAINVTDPLERIVINLIKDTSRFEAKDTTGDSFLFLRRLYAIPEAHDETIFINIKDTAAPYSFDSCIAVAFSFSSKEICENYFRKAHSDFSKFYVMKKRTPEKLPMLGYSIDYDFFDAAKKKVMSISMIWPFDMYPYYSFCISVYK